MYSKTKYPLPEAGNDAGRPNRLLGTGTGAPSSGIYAAGGPQSNVAGARRNPGDWSQGQSYYWRGKFKAPLCEPEHDEAFVEEPGIKVVESSHTDDEDEDDDDDDRENGHDEEEDDPLYPLDVLDDTIVEDDEEEDEDEEEEEEDDDEEEEEKRAKEPPPPAEGNRAEEGEPSTEAEVEKVLAITSSPFPSLLPTVSPAYCLPHFSSEPPPPSSLPQPQPEWTMGKIPAFEGSPSDSSTNSSLRSIPNGFSPLNYSKDLSCQASSILSHIPQRETLTPQQQSPLQKVPLTSVVTTCMSNIPVTCPSSTLSPVVISPGTSSPVLANFMPPPGAPSMLQKPQGGSNSRPSSRPTSRSSSPLAVGLTGNMWAGLPSADVTPSPSVKPQAGFFFQFGGGRGRANRLNLPLTRINAPRHKFTIRRVNEQESPAKRTAAYIDSRSQDPNRQNKVAPSPIWLRKFQDTSNSPGSGNKSPFPNSDSSGGHDGQPGSGTPGGGTQTSQLQEKSKQLEDGDPFSPPQGSFRPRSGTWSMATSRRNKLKQEKEEEAKLRQRRKSGDDLVAAASAATSSNSGAGSGFSTSNRRDPSGQHGGFFDSFRPRSKSDAKAIMQSRQRRKSGDDVLNAASKEKDKKKEASPGFLESFRPRSKSDAAKGKKPNIISTLKNTVQHSLVSPSTTTRSGRRSGDATPVEPAAREDVYHTWHAESKTTIAKVWDLFRSHRNESSEERLRRKSGGKHDKGQLVRRHSMEPERKRNGSSGSFGHTYLRGEDPNQAALTFRDCRGLPAAAQFMESVKRSDLERDESQILVKFFKYHSTYDLIPTSAKLVIFDTRLQVKKAFYALVYNGVRAAPLWDAQRQQFVGMLTITDFIRILQSFYSSPNRKMEELEEHKLEKWRTLLNDDVRQLISITPDKCLYEAIRSLIHHKIHRLPVIDPATGNVLYIITHKRILKFLYLYINELPKPSILLKTLRELNLGTYENIETAKGDTLIIEALNKFVERRISALPIVDDEGKLIDIYAKFDVINLAAEGTYHNLDVTLQQANEYRNEWFEGVLNCNLDETMEKIMERIVRAEVHRLVVVDKSTKVIGIISLSDILNELVLKPCHDDPASLRRTVADMEATLNGEQTEGSPVGDAVQCASSHTPEDLGLKTDSEGSVSNSWVEVDSHTEEKKVSSSESIEENGEEDSSEFS